MGKLEIEKKTRVTAKSGEIIGLMRIEDLIGVMTVLKITDEGVNLLLSAVKEEVPLLYSDSLISNIMETNSNKNNVENVRKIKAFEFYKKMDEYFSIDTGHEIITINLIKIENSLGDENEEKEAIFNLSSNQEEIWIAVTDVSLKCIQWENASHFKEED